MKRDKNKHRILVIEDNPGDFTIIEDFLGEEILNPEITHVNNFKSAAGLLVKDACIFDVILLDLSLRDKGGQELITEMMKIAPLIPIIILTGYTDVNFSIMSISQGIMDYLLKDDLNAMALYKSIKYAIERKKSISQLKESERRYSDLFHLSPQAMWVFDPETLKFIQVNKAAVELYGYSESEFLSMTLEDIKRKQDHFDEEEATKIKKSDKFFNQVIFHHKKSGEILEVEIFSTAIALDNKTLRSVIAYDVTEKHLFELKLIKAIIKTQEDERYEIGSELHDNVCQILAVSQFNLSALKKGLPESELPQYDQCKENIGLALTEIRNLSHRLAPTFFDDSTLEQAFKKLLDPFLIGSDCKVVLHFDEAVKAYPITTEVQLNLYRIMQEQFRNILKHAHATSIEVDVLIHKGKLKMKVTDNGVGFDSSVTRGGIGLANMKRRTELFAGEFHINSTPGHGCEMVVNIPLKEIT